MFFSLVLATLGRSEEVDRLLTSLKAQTHRDFELIVVDQNPNGGLPSLLEPYQNCFSIKHIQRPQDRGLSRGRNVGLQYVKDAVVTCPDDDCWYPPWLLEQVANYLEEYPDVDGVSGRTVANPIESFQYFPESNLSGRYLTSRLEVMRVPGMWALFLRSRSVESVGNFDETLGVGAGTTWGAAEDTDYYLRLLEAGFRLYANPNLVVFHPTASAHDVMHRDLDRSYRYGAGATRVWKRHRLPFWYFAYQVGRSGAGTILSLLQGRRSKAHWHWGAFRGKLKGWFSE